MGIRGGGNDGNAGGGTPGTGRDEAPTGGRQVRRARKARGRRTAGAHREKLWKSTARCGAYSATTDSLGTNRL